MCGGAASMVCMGKQCSKGQGKKKKTESLRGTWFHKHVLQYPRGTAKLLVWGMNEQSSRVGCKSFARKIAVNRILRFFQNFERDNPLKLCFCTRIICADSKLKTRESEGLPSHCPLLADTEIASCNDGTKTWGNHQGTLLKRALTLKEADHKHNLCKMTHFWWKSQVHKASQ